MMKAISKKEKIQLAVCAVCAVVLLAVISRGGRRGRPVRGSGGAPDQPAAGLFTDQFAGDEAGQKPARAVAGKEAAGSRLEAPGRYDELVQRSLEIDLVRDPFVPGRIVPRETAARGLILSGIVWDKDRALAVINGRILKEGDRIGSNVVISIESGMVIVSDGLRELELMIEP